MGKLATPDWILKGEKAPPKKKSGKTFKIRVCPKCGSSEVSVVLTGEEGQGTRDWECKACRWQGKNVNTEEISEDEFLELMEGK